MTIYYSDSYTVPLPPGHRFPMEKYRMLREALLERGTVAPDELHEAQPVDRRTLLAAHTPAYVDAFCDGTIDARAVRRIGLPWSPEFVRRSLASVGGTLAAARASLDEGIAGNLAGGTHHAFADHGEGFCVFNDIAVAALTLLAEGEVDRVTVIDLDVHQGNGTAAILGSDPRVFTLSLHGGNNYPFHKVPSSLDVPLGDGMEDAEYLTLLADAIPVALAGDPDLIFYQGGVDPLAADTLGRLAMTHEGLERRDRMILTAARNRSIPVVLTLGGGYARPISETVSAHVGTYRVARELAPGWPAGTSAGRRRTRNV